MGKSYVLKTPFKKSELPSAEVKLKRRARQIKALSIVQF